MARQDVKKNLKNLGQALLVLLAGSWVSVSAEPPRIAIIIDDLGYQKAAGERAIGLPGPIAYAILPNTPSDAYLAKFAHDKGKEVLLHLPLQAMQDRSAVGGSLLLDMSRQQFLRAFANSLEAVPHVVGVNSHRGSLLTRHPGHMSWLMEEILDRGDLFFVDSYTTAESVALRVANESGVPALRRDVFLDPDPQPETLVREFARLKKLARQQGFAVGIGHPYAGTLDFLERALPTLAEEGYDLVSISDLVASRANRVSTTAAD